MADQDDEEGPVPESQPTQQNQPSRAGGGMMDLAGRWNTWMDNPSNRAALMQFGIGMLTPMAGMSGLWQAGFALGHAGEAAASVQKQEREQQALEQKGELQQAQAERARQQAAHEGEMTQMKAAMLEQRKAEADAREREKEAATELTARRDYEKYRTNPLRDPNEPLMSFEQYYPGWRGQRGGPAQKETISSTQLFSRPGMSAAVQKGGGDPERLFKTFMDQYNITDPDALRIRLGLKPLGKTGGGT